MANATVNVVYWLQLQVGLWFKPIGLVQRSAANWRCCCIHRVNRVNSRNALA